MSRMSSRLGFVWLAALLVAPRVFACSACGCTLDSDWVAQGLAASGGWRLGLRYDYFVQDQLRSGTDAVARNQFAYPAAVEVQRYTFNRNTTLSLDASPNRKWGIAVSLPWYDRAHATITAGDTDLSTSHERGIGDLKIVGRYSGIAARRESGILFGIKLPTGRFTDRFDSGPQRGETVDRGLQLGTGTVDAIFGAYRFGAWSPDWGYFAQVLVQQPLDARAGFRPSAGLNINLGVRYVGNEGLVPQLQLNTRIEGRERGSNADTENSGATLLYLSPGVTYTIDRRLFAYAFLQLPLYQRVNGLQLEATRFASLGMVYHF
jgi:hypothetical protein